MKQTRTIEIVTGFFIILGFVALYVVATSATNIKSYGEAGFANPHLFTIGFFVGGAGGDHQHQVLWRSGLCDHG